MFQMITLWSSEHEANVFPSAEMATLLTQPSWPEKVLLQNPVETYHNFKVLSLEHERIRSPSKTKSTKETLWLWP